MSNIERERISVKVGGSSVAKAADFVQLKKIVEADPRRDTIAFSAPGRLNSENKTEPKITDLLIACFKNRNTLFDGAFDPVMDRFTKIREELNLSDITDELRHIRSQIPEKSEDWTVTRGEYLNTKIGSEFLGAEFIDATELFVFNAEGEFQLIPTVQKIQRRLTPGKLYAVPAWYGIDENGNIRVFRKENGDVDRNAADLTGVILGDGIGAIYSEIWSDKSLTAADPDVVDDPQKIGDITFEEMEEYAYTGAKILHPGAIQYAFNPKRNLSIPIHIKDFSRPDEKGTYIVRERISRQDETVIGIAGKDGFEGLTVRKPNVEGTGFLNPLTTILYEQRVAVDHVATGNTSVTFFVHEDQLIDRGAETSKRATLTVEIDRQLDPRAIEFRGRYALVCVVGQNIKEQEYEVLNKISDSLKKIGIRTESFLSAPKENSIVLVVNSQDYARIVRSLYSTFLE